MQHTATQGRSERDGIVMRSSGWRRKWKAIWRLLKQSAASWRKDYAPSMGGALAYYTLFSIAPVLIIAIAVAGAVFGEEAARGEIIVQLRGLLGESGATAIEGLIESARKPTDGILATGISIALLLVGATTVFAELQSDLDRIWKVKPQGGAVWNLVRARVLSFGMILVLAFLLLVSLVVSAALTAFGNWYGAWFEGWAILLETLNFIISFAITTALIRGDLQSLAACRNRMARRVDRRGRHGRVVRGR
jgi:membrane protein